MKFYVAAKFEHYERARQMIDFLKRYNHDVTFDWTRTEEFDWQGRPKQSDPHELSKEQLEGYALADAVGVEQAHLFVLLADHESLNGALVELGMAIAAERCKQVFVLSALRWNIFFEHPKVRQMTIEDFVGAFETAGVLP